MFELQVFLILFGAFVSLCACLPVVVVNAARKGKTSNESTMGVTLNTITLAA